MLNHPDILTVHDVGSHDGSPYIVSELLEGRTLRDVLEEGRLLLRKAIHFGAQIAHGLASAHAKQIVHRDVKLENLFVTKDGRIKILDGLKRPLNGGGCLSSVLHGGSSQCSAALPV
jgi:serine/threonine protein kinase